MVDEIIIAGVGALNNVACPSCRVTMIYDQQDKFYSCPNCHSTYWPNEQSVSCPGCGRPMKQNSTFGYFKCSGCGSEFWPPEEKDSSEVEPNEEDPSTWKCSGSVYSRGPVTLFRKGGSNGKRHKKRPKAAKAISDRYVKG